MQKEIEWIAFQTQSFQFSLKNMPYYNHYTSATILNGTGILYITIMYYVSLINGDGVYHLARKLAVML